MVYGVDAGRRKGRVVKTQTQTPIAGSEATPQELITGAGVCIYKGTYNTLEISGNFERNVIRHFPNVGQP